MKLYIIVGEASGDLHASNLMRALQKQKPDIEFRFWGGDLMKKISENIVKHIKDLAFMGFFEVLLNIRTIIRNIAFCKKDIEKFNPDAIVFVDYPGFNLWIAKWAKKKGFKTYYYISPQVWAWKENRVKRIKRDVDHMFVILPFEEDFYQKKHGYPVHFVGHPLLDELSSRKKSDVANFRKCYALGSRSIIALLPGSRKQEVKKMLSVMLSIVDSFKDCCFVIAGAPTITKEFYNPFVDNKNVFLVYNNTYQLLDHAKAALVTSGTATLETALFKVPQVVCYKGNALSYLIARCLIKLKYISLVNLIAEKKIVTELIQNKFNKKNLIIETEKTLDNQHRMWIEKEYENLKISLGEKGASDNTARLMLQLGQNHTFLQ